MNDLEKYFTENPGRLINKWKHYFEIYDRHLSRFRDTDVCVVEFGVFQGGSLQMWKHYFGPRARIYGIDINPNCRKVAEEQIEIIIGDQEDRSFLRSLKDKIPRIDILVDDGGHTMTQQINTFEELFPHVDRNGVYLCEDTHTSYWPEWGGGYQKPDTFVEYSKHFIDYLNAWHSKNTDELAVSDFTRSTHALHFYDSLLVIEKRPVEPPTEMKTGQASVPAYKPRRGLIQRLKNLFRGS
jgi:23S rRNA U2552 (ribose-2'-O)-methylase RlmE/FtsJ